MKLYEEKHLGSTWKVYFLNPSSWSHCERFLIPVGGNSEKSFITCLWNDFPKPIPFYILCHWVYFFLTKKQVENTSCRLYETNLLEANAFIKGRSLHFVSTLDLYQDSASSRLLAAISSYWALTSATIWSMLRFRELSICTMTDVSLMLACSSRSSWSRETRQVFVCFREF